MLQIAAACALIISWLLYETVKPISYQGCHKSGTDAILNIREIIVSVSSYTIFYCTLQHGACGDDFLFKHLEMQLQHLGKAACGCNHIKYLAVLNKNRLDPEMYSLICGIIRWQVVSNDNSEVVAEFTPFCIRISAYFSISHSSYLHELPFCWVHF